jgi:CBS domain-containing protein
MIVMQILSSKTNARVLTVSPVARLREVARVLDENRIGAVVVSHDGATVAGIVSERDIVREIARRGEACLDQPATSTMTTSVMACAETDSADEVLARMTAGRFRHMPVMHDGRMVGIISIGDVVKARLDELAMEKDALEGMIKGF